MKKITCLKCHKNTSWNEQLNEDIICQYCKTVHQVIIKNGSYLVKLKTRS